MYWHYMVNPNSLFNEHPKRRYKRNTYNNIGALKYRIQRTLKGRNTGFIQYRYKQHKNQLRPDKVYSIRKHLPNAQRGYHWVNGKWNLHHRDLDMEQTDIFSHFNGNFFLEKIGNKYHFWIDLVDAQAINYQGNPESHHITDSKPVVNAWFTDTDGTKSFPLTAIAAHFKKGNIDEDQQQSPHVYHDVNMGIGAVKYWSILGNGNDKTKPHIIAHAGETIVIDTGRMKVYKTDGTDLTKYTSFGSTFPPLKGGIVNNINFYPTVGTDCDLNITYVPRIK